VKTSVVSSVRLTPPVEITRSLPTRTAPMKLEGGNAKLRSGPHLRCPDIVDA